MSLSEIDILVHHDPQEKLSLRLVAVLVVTTECALASRLWAQTNSVGTPILNFIFIFILTLTQTL